MVFSSDIEKGDRPKEDDLDQTVSLPSYNSKSSDNSKSRILPIDPSVVSVVESLQIQHRQEDENQRQSRLCFGSCCDFLRACIIVDIIFIILDIVGIFFFLLGITINKSDAAAETHDDYTYDDAYDEEETSDCVIGCNSKLLNVLIIKNVLGMMFCTIGIIGAAKFHQNLVLTTAIWYVIDCIWSIITGRWTGVVVTACFAYPHFALFLALKKQQITRKDYDRERYSCCDKK